jgi:hypothetical protein
MLARVKELLNEGGYFFCSTPNSLLQPKLEDGITPRNPYHLKEFKIAEYKEIMAKFFSSVEIFGQGLDPNFVRFRKAIDDVHKKAEARDFQMWTNPIMKFGWVLNSLFGKDSSWESPFFMPAEIGDVVIENRKIEEKKYLISKCCNSY